MATRRIEFIYFDMGNVLLSFDHGRASRQIASLCDVDERRVHATIFDSGLQDQYERGDVDTQTFYARCRESFGDCPREALLHAVADIFGPLTGVHDVVRQLHSQGYRLGVLSNTCEAHWRLCIREYPVFELFDEYVLSYEVNSMKPEAMIYEHAAQVAGVEPGAIFFLDDRAENVAAAQEIGFDAVRFVDADSLRVELTQRRLV